MIHDTEHVNKRDLSKRQLNAKPKVIVPEKYNKAETSPFTAKVESGSNTFTFDISSKDD